jgi:lipoprotein NlpD
MAAGDPAAVRVVPGAGLIRLATMLGATLALAGCAELTRWDPGAPQRPPPAQAQTQAPTAGVHIVQRGDTLYQIAFSHRLDWRDVAAWNRLGNADRIYPGQQLRLTPPAGGAQAAPAAAPPSRTAGGARPAPQAPPVTGRPAPVSPAPATPARSGSSPSPQWHWPASGPVVSRFGESRRNPTGIGIGGVDGAEIRAAAEGTVAYSGGGLIGYGMLIIIKHNDSYLSAYGYNQSLMVKEGERVKSGQTIALMGRGPADRPLLHFEIRVDGKPADPARFLPMR